MVPFSFYVSSMPAYYRSVTSIDVLADSLRSPIEMTRIRAAYRMAELKNPAAVPLLKRAYEDEPLRNFLMDQPNGLKYYALVAIGIIGGDQADNYLCKEADEIILKKGVAWAKGDMFSILWGIIEGLSMTKSECADSLLSRIIQGYEKKSQINPTLQIAYTARYRLRLLRNDSRTGKYALLDSFRAQAYILHRNQETTFANTDEQRAFLVDNYRSHALQRNAIEIGIADPASAFGVQDDIGHRGPFYTRFRLCN